jgi:hypothetical protein
MPDFSSEPVEVYSQEVWEVYDPWEAKIVATFTTEREARMFADLYMETGGTHA